MIRTAAIDCGTNSIRLLIADVDDDGRSLTDVVRLMRVVRLGEGVDTTGRLSAAALERTFTAVREYAELIGLHGADRIRFVATSATRDAENREEFTSGISALLGVAPEVVSGAEEAALSFDGALSVLPAAASPADESLALVVDLGGGSTEFVVGTSAGVTASRSMDMGCVRFTERYLAADPPTAQEIATMETEVRRLIAEASQDVPFDRVSRLIGVAGTITTITAHALDLPGYSSADIHGAELDQERVWRASTELLAMSRESRAALPYMHPGRVDVIGAGALIWRTITAHLADATGGRVKTSVASEHDILDGIALSQNRKTTQ
ncbi:MULTISPECIES: Ppx/GppA phosphatase family protein [unclassified Arthrobacter]|uniref:Ppx/GppA phosphatase family protein n=1 Tax=unclassified Arthrobacter TaxID=235627 RepID=UPI0002D6CC15|nr:MULTISPECIES: Ppx/GppA phosphatase family protein [unclassified Arthrobacter]